MNPKMPLISFVVFSYNQEKYISEAVDGAFSQQCAPMEIILSDDCSKDETFFIMQEMAAAYSGPHEVIVRRNEANLGLIDHINTVFQLARGEWVVVAAGDDISMPNRVEEISKVIGQHPDINMVSSALIVMDENGDRTHESCVFQDKGETPPANIVITGLTELVESKSPYVHGATLAYSKKLIQAFPPMPSDAVYEDGIFRIRSALLGSKAHINRPLVFYRNHPLQTTIITSRITLDLYNKYKKLAVGGYVTSRQALDEFNYFSSKDFLIYERLSSYLKSEFDYKKFRYRLIVWKWPFRLGYFLCMLIKSPKMIMRLRKSHIVFSLFPVAVATALFGILKIK